jgi:16S rRNA (guanine966-N2)-methyltransferase
VRIVSGKFKGRTIIAPGNLSARPTTDFAKEGLFNILYNNFYFEEVKVLDLFAGTGNITYEFVSRGVEDVICIEGSAASARFIKETADKLAPGKVRVLNMEVSRFLKNCKEQFDIIFADPPYEMPDIDKVVQQVFELNLLKPGGWLALEHSVKLKFTDHPHFVEQRHYGKVNFSFFYKKEEENVLKVVE